MFKSEPVLSEELRNKIYERIVAPSGKWKDRTPYLAVSREFGIDVRRVAAVVRLMEVEKQMIAKVSSSLHLFSGHSGALECS
jgi:hypothetical protein